jgi:hypothetical protein
VQPVGADHQVKPARGRVLEGDVDSPGVLAQRGDRVAEEELGVVAGGITEDRRQVGPGHLDLAAIWPAQP